jgi:hypothetical protein
MDDPEQKLTDGEVGVYNVFEVMLEGLPVLGGDVDVDREAIRDALDGIRGTSRG